ncbi:DUF4158 domain-containing protein [Streptomyces sp. NPDC002788]
MLKFFELEGRFPDVLEEVPPAAVEYVADLVKVPATGFARYTLVGRTAEYHRKQIRMPWGSGRRRSQTRRHWPRGRPRRSVRSS